MSATAVRQNRSKPERIFMRVVRISQDMVGRPAVIPADPYAESKMREKGYRTSDLLGAEFKKLRSGGFNRLVHRIGQLVVANIDDFSGMDAHACIKRLQWESNTECDEVGISMRAAWEQFSSAILAIPSMYSIAPALKVVGSMLPETSLLFMRYPRSLSFESMDEGRYREAARSICQYIVVRYWPTETAAGIEALAEAMVTE